MYTGPLPHDVRHPEDAFQISSNTCNFLWGICNPRHSLESCNFFQGILRNSTIPSSLLLTSLFHVIFESSSQVDVLTGCGWIATSMGFQSESCDFDASHHPVAFRNRIHQQDMNLSCVYSAHLCTKNKRT